MYAIFLVFASVAAATAGAAAVLAGAQGPETTGDAGALRATFATYARGARGYVNMYGTSPNTLDQVRLDPAIALATRNWAGRAPSFADSATWSLQTNPYATPTARDVCVEIANIKSTAAYVTIVNSLPRGAYASAPSCAAAPAAGAAPAAFPATMAFRLPAVS